MSPAGRRTDAAERTAPVYVISAAAELTDMHPQTLRQYDRLGLVVPQRQAGRQRRYSRADVERLRTIQSLSRSGVSLEGIRRIVALQREVEQLQDTVVELASQVDRLHQASRLSRVFTVGAAGDVSARYGERRAAGAGASGASGAGASGAEDSGAEDSAAARTDSAATRPDPAQTRPGPTGRGARALPAGPSRSARILAWRPSQD